MTQPLVFYNKMFENAVREALNVFEGPLYRNDVEKITQLELADFDFEAEDFATLIKFKNLKKLDISAFAWKLNFLKAFPELEDLHIEVWNNDNILAFNDFKNLHKLKSLTVSGGMYSTIQFINLENLQPLNLLKSLSLHEFGFVNLQPLANCSQIEEFYCRYGKRVANISVVKNFTSLKSLTLIGLKLDNLDFLDAFPDDIYLELCGLEITEPVNVDKLKRFNNADICEITVNGI